MVANVANRLPHFCVFGRAKVHDSKMEDELFNSLKEDDIGIADRAYNHFRALLTHLVLRWLKYKSGAACTYESSADNPPSERQTTYRDRPHGSRQLSYTTS